MHVTLQQGATLAITPQTLNYLGNDQVFETSGYSVTIADVRLLNTFEATGINTAASTTANVNSTTTLGTNVSSTSNRYTGYIKSNYSKYIVWCKCNLLSTLTFTGLDSGARITIPITITKSTT